MTNDRSKIVFIGPSCVVDRGMQQWEGKSFKNCKVKFKVVLKEALEELEMSQVFIVFPALCYVSAFSLITLLSYKHE